MQELIERKSRKPIVQDFPEIPGVGDRSSRYSSAQMSTLAEVPFTHIWAIFVNFHPTFNKHTGSQHFPLYSHFPFQGKIEVQLR